MLNGEMFLKIHSPIYLTMDTDIEGTFSHIRSLPTKVGVSGKVVGLV